MSQSAGLTQLLCSLSAYYYVACQRSPGWGSIDAVILGPVGKALHFLPRLKYCASDSLC